MSLAVEPYAQSQHLRGKQHLRGWRNTVELVLFEISNSMKPYSSGFHAYTGKSRPAIGLFEATNLDEVSNRIPPIIFTPNLPTNIVPTNIA